MSIDMRSLARAGAQSRLATLLAEVDEIRQAFPDLDDGSGPRGQGRSRGAVADGPNGAGQTRTRRRMSAAQKRAVGERMRAYWARRRAGATPTDGGEPTTPVAPATRVMSAEARKKKAAAQRKRWRAVKRAATKR